MTGGDRLGKFASGKILSPYLGERLGAVTDQIKFRTRNGQVAYGYDATVLADLCESVLNARRDGKLQKQQEHIALIRVDEDDDLLLEAKADVEFEDPRMVAELDFHFTGVKFPSAGEYRFQIWSSSDLLMERRFIVNQVAKPESQDV